MVVLPDAGSRHRGRRRYQRRVRLAGERCMAISVVVAVGDIADELIGASRNDWTV